MRQIVCEQPNHLVYTEAETPVSQPGEALVRIRRIGICGTDMHAYKGNQPFFSYPRVLGHELSGEIVGLGDASAPFQAGDIVSIIPYLECGSCIACRNGKTNCCTNMKVLGVHKDGGMAEFMTVSYHLLIKIEGLSLDHAALIEPLSIGAHAIRRAEIKQGEYVLVIGAGPIGLGVMALAKQEGAKVIAMDVNPERLAFCSEWAKVDYTVNALENPLDQIASITSGEFPTTVFDATGNARSMTEAFRYPAHGGKLVYVGLVKADISFDDPEFHKRELTLMGSRNATREDFEYVIRSIKQGSIPLDAYITHRSDFSTMIDHFETWLDPSSKVIKAIVEL
ncbi:MULTISPECIES: zinc-binding alcohol dehydrogenase family protein [unclassified Paenibacillus]|uniref:zinc-binding alcohol dehydrogenase family protein n=1 Tax=unclassified Paenibacillus TaxID=185978 RepID=UPI001AE42548|nr:MULTISPECIES: zinc-binding alcohol dehydrogenase family protein [unclassified Paenibacillus]MBP1156781.1 2-desacetyl-2-hydroxyethyl bacteriochlorophyllide A dehydrogenase [Paenibacillus sp. PvP091]MBP1172480.1 2-desacetyl-2-hydroxyethyl bacteriochlorophyllide A dehydrogenase [Paenibacillus sp. PvR098]MBP2438861.1 2-desacetyl-2-hydroxyethyl bacteriochlorophyllide A dehydrogenase [Paenibacillus sp. PvP052]